MLKTQQMNTCENCSKQLLGKYPLYPLEKSSGVCEICNHWECLTRVFILPEQFTKKKDLDKLYTQLMQAMFDCFKKRDFESALQINYELNEVIHKAYEKEITNATIITFPRKPRRSFRKESEVSRRAV